MQGILKDTTLTNVVIPGSHDAFTASIDVNKGLAPDTFQKAVRLLLGIVFDLPFGIGDHYEKTMHRWAVTQSMTITEQLNYGIRYLDFRLCGKEGTNIIDTCHGFYADSASSTLAEVKRFSDQYPNEFIILHYSSFADLSQVRRNEFANQLHATFGNKLIPNDTALNHTTLGELWDKGQTIAVIYEDGDARKSLGSNSRRLWSIDQFLINGWADTMDETTLIERVKENWACRCNVHRGDGPDESKLFNLSLQPTVTNDYIKDTILHDLDLIKSNINFVRSVSELSFPPQIKLIEWLKDLHRTQLDKLNIISADFVGHMELVELAIVLNYMKHDRTPPVSTVHILNTPNEAGWFNENVLVNIVAVDNEDGVGPLAISYQVPGSPGFVRI